MSSVRYTPRQKRRIKDLYDKTSSSTAVSKIMGCSVSTVIYTVHPEVYDRHLEHVRYMSNIKRERR